MKNDDIISSSNKIYLMRRTRVIDILPFYQKLWYANKFIKGASLQHSIKGRKRLYILTQQTRGRWRGERGIKHFKFLLSSLLNLYSPQELDNVVFYWNIHWIFMVSYDHLSNFAAKRWFLSLNCKLGKTIFIYVYLELRYQFYCRKHSRHWSNLMQWVVARPVVFSVKLFYASMGIRFIVIYVAYPLRFDWALRRSAKLVLDATVWLAIKYELQYLHIWIESTVTISWYRNTKIT